jgi:hypothetical protein
VIQYNPPKSHVGGQQVGRLAAADVVERGLRILDAQCSVIDAQPSELMVGWNDGPHARVAEGVVHAADQTLGRPTAVNELPSGDGKLFRQRRWPFAAERLPVVATWFDTLADAIKSQDVVAHSSTMWIFAWRDEPAPLRPMESAGGMFGIHLGRPHRITTLFSFRDMERYASVKAALSELELIELSDKHLSPKVGATSRKRQAK